MTELAILVPVLGRPDAAAPLVENITQNTIGEPRIVFICDPSDHAQVAACDQTDADVLLLEGSYATKINAAARTVSERFLFLGADDLHFHAGWLPEALARMRGRIRVVGTNDLGNRRVLAGRHATHSLVARSYLEQGTIDAAGLLHEGYSHNFCDDEFVATAKKRSVWAHAGRSIVEHRHPSWGKAELDATYRRGLARFEDDRALFLSRRALWR